jgi:hypothetical protein
MLQRTRPVRLISLALGLAVVLVGLAPAATSVIRAQEPQTRLYGYRGPLPAGAFQLLASSKLDVESGAITPESGTIEILVEETEHDLEETEHVDYIMTRFESTAEIFGESRETWGSGSPLFQPCTPDHWRWVSESIQPNFKLTEDGVSLLFSVYGPTTLSYTRPACSHEEPLESGDVVIFKIFPGVDEDTGLACVFDGSDTSNKWDFWTPEECLARELTVELSPQS